MTTRLRQTLALLYVLLAIVSLEACHKRVAQPTKNNPLPKRASLIIDQDQHLREPVIKLMQLTNIATAANLSESIEPTQKAWLRPPGSERAYLVEEHPNLSSIMLPEFDKLGLVGEVSPIEKEYDYVLLLGAMYETFKMRLNFLEELVKQGLKIKSIALLGSHRPLERQYELDLMLKSHVFTHLPLTEIEMMQALFNASSIKQSQPNIKVIEVASPMKIEDGVVKRANTKDTVIDFLKLGLIPGFALSISSQPYVLRQDLVLKELLVPPWKLSTAGPRAPLNLPTDVYLDELARTLYELRNFSRKQ